MTVGPFIGMRDVIDPGATVPTHASLLQNVYPVDPLIPSAIVGRPGANLAGVKLAGAVQGGGQFTLLSGTEISWCVAGGLFYTFNWTTRTWANTITTATLSGLSITLDTTARVSGVTLANKLVISDGVNTPWMWDGASTVTKLTQCPVLYGPPTVYYAKLFGIKASNRSTIVWSEENDPTLGYDFAIGTYPNYWQLGQTDQDELFALVGTNNALLYFRATSIGAIHGPVASDFVNAGVHDAVSATIGTTAPYAVLLRNTSVFFLDLNGRPHVLSVGSGVTPLWADVLETVRNVPRSALGSASCVDYPETGLVLFCLAEAGYTIPNLVLAYNPVAIEGGAPPCVAVWRGWTMNAAWAAKNGAGVPVVMHGDQNGYVFDHANPEDNVWSDTAPDGTPTAISHIVLTPAIGYSPKGAMNWVRADLAFRLTASLSSLQLNYDTPRGSSTPVTANATAGVATYGTAIWDTATYAVDAVEKKLTMGLQANQCRWVKFRIAHAVAGEPFGFMQMTLDGTPASQSPTLA